MEQAEKFLHWRRGTLHHRRTCRCDGIGSIGTNAYVGL